MPTPPKENPLTPEQISRLGVLSNPPAAKRKRKDAEAESAELEAIADQMLGKCRTSAGVLSKDELDRVKSRERYKGVGGRIRNDRVYRRVG